MSTVVEDASWGAECIGSRGHDRWGVYVYFTAAGSTM